MSSSWSSQNGEIPWCTVATTRVANRYLQKRLFGRQALVTEVRPCLLFFQELDRPNGMDPQHDYISVLSGDEEDDDNEEEDDRVCPYCLPGEDETIGVLDSISFGGGDRVHDANRAGDGGGAAMNETCGVGGP